jgi:hypothetical protein
MKYYIRYRSNFLNEAGEFRATMTRAARAFASEEEAQAHATSLSLPERQYEIVRRKDRDSDQ